MSADCDAGADQMGNPYLDRSVVLCRTCMRPLTWETRTEPGFKPRTGWHDDARSDALVCFKAVDYRHVPLTAREWAYYEAGQQSATVAALRPLRFRVEVACDGYAALSEADVPDEYVPEDYIAGAAASAEAIRSALTCVTSSGKGGAA